MIPKIAMPKILHITDLIHARACDSKAIFFLFSILIIFSPLGYPLMDFFILGILFPLGPFFKKPSYAESYNELGSLIPMVTYQQNSILMLLVSNSFMGCLPSEVLSV